MQAVKPTPAHNTANLPIKSVAKHAFIVSENNWSVTLLTDDVIVEEPLQISLNWQDIEGKQHSDVFTITMRTPGQDNQLVIGLLFAEGIINSLNEIASIQFSSPSTNTEDETVIESAINKTQNHAEVLFSQGYQPRHQDYQRNIASQSSCGICGKTSLKVLALRNLQLIDVKEHWLDIKTLSTLLPQLNNAQTLFQQTGAVHGAALFNADGQLISCHEDVGRHNAVDKVIGELLISNTKLTQSVLLLSGRVSFELMQKAIVANIPVVIAVGAPSSLAVLAAQQFNVTLIGFCQQNKMNVYHGHWRLKTHHKLQANV